MVQYILCDIEGTTTSIAFVHDILFPYAKTNIGAFVRANQGRADLQEALQGVRNTLKEERGIEEADIELIVETLERWIEEDRKHTSLKEIQGKLWVNGYQNHDFKGHIYEDVLPAFIRWKAMRLDIGIYSSGSVEAQKLLFGHSEVGDLTTFLSHYFDTHIGHKREVESYQRIAKDIALPPEDVLFLSDIPEELDAAQEAGMQTIQLLRPGNIATDRHKTVTDFSLIGPF